MLKILGLIMTCLGLVMVAVAFLEWCGVKIRTKEARKATAGENKTIWDFLLAFLEKAGWVVTAGLILVYLGLKALGLGGI